MAIVGFRHIGLKAVSIALAALIWLIVSGEQVVERALRIPLEFTNVPSSLEIVGDPPDVVDVRVRGSSGALSRIATGELVAVLDLVTARAGQRLFHLSAADVRSPFGVEVVQLSPSNVYMTFEPSASKRVPVVPEVEGEPAAGFEIGTVTAEPSTVEVEGPTSAVKAMTSAVTEPLSAAGASATVSELVTVGVPDPSVRLKTPGPVRVTVNVTPAQRQWAIAGVGVKVLQAKGHVTINPAAVTVHVRGPRDTMGADASAFEASIDVEGLRPGDYQLPVRVVLPARIGMVRVEPGEVRVRIRQP
jgi:YbbR domain-containing protein